MLKFNKGASDADRREAVLQLMLEPVGAKELIPVQDRGILADLILAALDAVLESVSMRVEMSKGSLSDTTMAETVMLPILCTVLHMQFASIIEDQLQHAMRNIVAAPGGMAELLKRMGIDPGGADVIDLGDGMAAVEVTEFFRERFKKPN